MLKIEVNNETISVPESWSDILLGDYETYYKDKPLTPRERVGYVAKVLKISPAVLLQWPAEVFNLIVETLGFMFRDNPAEPVPFVDVDGVKYVVLLEDKISLGAWVDAEETQKGEEAVLSNVLAIVCRPAAETYDYANNEARQKMFAALPVSKVLGVLAFFLHFKNGLDTHTAAFTKMGSALDLLQRNTKSFLRRGGGTKSLPIWQRTKFWFLTKLLRYRLRRYLHLFSTKKINKLPRRHKGN